ncbi:MAG: DUF2066 domain-containing protein [Aliidiomarina sp.]|uniref:DUF2066 domain-containing protein n=1 Tax=Aliidiomarina sp. TaxID=1872439 RepID=UPI0025BFDDD2|nr:DUF2066 domain-containing protein [Aliidiomarina sp.]MCH8502002.1 DUF2066 domain-containing protein [Aliidiomarina sp.]
MRKHFSQTQRQFKQSAQTRITVSVVGLFLALLMVFPVQALQGPLSDLLRGEIAVEGQTRNERQRELPTIFREVLVRLTGTTEVLEHERVRAELRQVNDYLLQFGYQQRDGQLYLQASFDETRVRQLLQQANVPLWTGQRPNLLLWLAEDHPELGVRLVTRSEEREFLQALRATTQRRGVEILMPLMDLEDQMAIGPRDVWGRFQREVLRASERYPVSGIVSARMYRQVEEDYFAENVDDREGIEVEVVTDEPLDDERPLILEATVIVGDMSFNTFMVGDDEASLAEQFVHEVSDRIAAIFISRGDREMAQIRVRIVGLRQVSQVLSAENLLTSQAQVQSVHLQQFQQGVADFTVVIRGGAQALAQALDFDRRLRRTALRLSPVAEGDTDEPAVSEVVLSDEPDVEFEWQ